MNFTGGTVRFLKRVQQQQFEPAEAEASISWSATDDGDSSAMRRAEAEAIAQVHRMLGLQPVASNGPVAERVIASLATDKIAAVAAERVIASLATDKDKIAAAALNLPGSPGVGEVVTTPMGIPPGLRRGRKPKDTGTIEVPVIGAAHSPLDLPGAAPVNTAASVAPTPAATAPKVVPSDPLGLPGASPVVQAPAAAADFDIVAVKPAGKVYSNGDVGVACATACARLREAGDLTPMQTIGVLVGTFGVERSSEVPADKREAFIAQLGLLEPNLP